MKTRKKKTTVTTVRFVNVTTPELVVIESADLSGVRGKFVKLAPRILASERDLFDGVALKKAAIEAGALAVVIAPVFYTEARKAETSRVATAKTPRSAVAEWFDAQTASAVSDGHAADIVEAHALIHSFMDLEGL